MRIDGIDELLGALHTAHDDIDDDANEILRENANEFVDDTVLSARENFVKGYWTGNLARQIESAKNGHLEYEVTSQAGYSGLVEYGTRYMEPETFMKPVYEKFITQINEDFERLLNG